MDAGTMMFFMSTMIIFTFILLYLMLLMISATKRMVVRGRMKKINLNEYEIITNSKGFPSMLVNMQDKNKIVYL